jgi:hypothetical protein
MELDVFWLIGDAREATAGQTRYRLAITGATKI